jgi:hypothetical protein
MAIKRARKRQAGGEARVRPTAAAREAPFGPDDYLALDNTAARSLPRQLAAEAETQRVIISASGRRFDTSAQRRSQEAPGALVIDVPKGTGLGSPGARGHQRGRGRRRAEPPGRLGAEQLAVTKERLRQRRSAAGTSDLEGGAVGGRERARRGALGGQPLLAARELRVDRRIGMVGIVVDEVE